MHWHTFKEENNSTGGGDGDVGSARYEPVTGTTSPMPDHKGFMLKVKVKVVV